MVARVWGVSPEPWERWAATPLLVLPKAWKLEPPVSYFSRAGLLQAFGGYMRQFPLSTGFSHPLPRRGLVPPTALVHIKGSFSRTRERTYIHSA